MEQLLNFENFHLAPKLDKQAQSALLHHNPRLENALVNSAANGLPPISVLPLAGQFLSLLTKAMGVKSVLEVGTLGGYSSICFAEAGARVTSIEIDSKHRDVALENVKDVDVEVLLGAASDVMPKLVDEGKLFDLVFIDADLASQWDQFDLAVRLTRPNGCIFLDDVVISMLKEGHVGEQDRETILTKIGKDERVKATLVPVVACHPISPNPVFNGFIFAVKNE